MIQLSAKFVNPDDRLYKNGSRVKPLEPYTDILCHGTPTELLIYGNNGEEWSYSAKEAVQMILNSQEYNGGDIRLLSCSTGNGEECIAQQIANQLGVNVLAPTETLYINEEGKLFVTDSRELAVMWDDGEPVKETGKWVLFRPRKE